MAPDNFRSLVHEEFLLSFFPCTIFLWMWMVKLYTEIDQFYVILALKLKNSSMILLKDYVDPELVVDIQNGVGDNSADIELELGNDGAMIGSSFETTSNDGH
ncbi:hypothetical protein CFP56_017140 [Quercus suber]|uniref:Uncharacterized protein n=1 Tax=Quercus suber TaxID=58331 RepID=A0AAW0M2E4_QUESU